jgi:hypothetical protein
MKQKIEEQNQPPRTEVRGAVAAVAVMLLALLMVWALNSRAQSSGMFRRVNSLNSYFATTYQPFLVYTNNGTNAGYSPPVTLTVSNASQWTWNNTLSRPTNNPANWTYVGKDWLPGAAVTLILGVYAPSPGTNGYYTNYLTTSPDGNYWTASNTIAVGGQLTVGQTNWFYAFLGNYPYTNTAFVAWDGLWSNQTTNGAYVVAWYYQVAHPSF